MEAVEGGDDLGTWMALMLTRVWEISKPPHPRPRTRDERRQTRDVDLELK